MNIAIVGTGYVGLVSGACLADFGHIVTCVDSNAARIDALRAGDVPFYEPGLTELVLRQVGLGRLHFTTSVADAMESAIVVFLAVGTPSAANGEADLSQVFAVASDIAPHLHTYRVIVTKSTVPVGTGALIEDFLRRGPAADAEFDVVSNPEFLREGSAISDFMRPDRIVVGTGSERAAAVMREIYRPLYLIETPIIFTNVETAEMIKYAANAFLAVKISFMNDVANLCDRTGADVHLVAKGMGLDKRIGSKFLHPGPGFGGSCFPKDTRGLAALGSREGVPQRVVEAAIDVNTRQRQVAIDKIIAAGGGASGQRIAVLGLAFKPNTSDVRESPALLICQALAARGDAVVAYDPVAMPEAARAVGPTGGITFAADAYSAAQDADVLVIATEWNEFRSLNLDRLRTLLRCPALVDLRNVLDPADVRAAGFSYWCTGREHVTEAPTERRPALGAEPVRGRR
jgi:UDPglucose 6-dehydrogenase